MDTQLDNRKITILKAIIKTYLETGEPVGSRTISKYSELKLSSATIRNEMSDLEEMGYIIQPHTSAGRIPSDKGYRFYVDQIMQEKDNEVTEFKDMMVQKVDKLELVLKKMAQVLAANTNYAAMISGPSYHKTKLKFIQLSRVEAHKLLVVVVVEGNIVKNTMIDIAEELGEQELLNLNILLNSSLNGLTIEGGCRHSQAGGGAGLKRGCGSDQGRRRRSSDLYQRGYEYFSVSGAFRRR